MQRGKKLLLQLLLGSLSKLSTCQWRGDVLLAEASSSPMSLAASSMGNRGFPLQLPTLEERGVSLPERP